MKKALKDDLRFFGCAVLAVLAELALFAGGVVFVCWVVKRFFFSEGD